MSGSRFPPAISRLNLSDKARLLLTSEKQCIVLFNGDRLTAVLDWPEAAVGHAAWDVAICRSETILTLGLEVGDLILAAYESETGQPLEHLAWWDLVAACHLEPYIDTWTTSANYLGPAGLAVDVVRQRFHDYVSRATDLLDSPSRC